MKKNQIGKITQLNNKEINMKLRDWLIDRRITQKQFASAVGVTRCHLSSVMSGFKPAGKKLAKSIEVATHGNITSDDILSGRAIGYEGKKRKVSFIKNSSSNNFSSQKRFSLL